MLRHQKLQWKKKIRLKIFLNLLEKSFNVNSKKKFQILAESEEEITLEVENSGPSRMKDQVKDL